ncbi:MAG: hypothetical protein WBA74_11085, partial [Cyclobacteriaceae bacterium]
RFGSYLSYKHEIFAESRSVTGDFPDRSLQEILEILLKDSFQYKIIDDYVIITRAEKESPSPEAQETHLIYDTVRVKMEEIKVVYDTQRIIQNVPVYDTIKTEQKVIVYDTITVRSPPKNKKKIHAGFFFGPSYRTRSSPGMEYYGLSAGGLLRYNFKKFNIQVDANYELLLNTVRYSMQETVTETSIDTVSVFFVVRDGVRTPVYITEEVETTTEIRTDSEKLNNLQFLSVSVTSGYNFTSGKVRAGINIGVGMDWLVSSNEHLITTDTILETGDITYQNPAINLLIQLPIGMSRQRTSFNITPYLKYGLNNDFVIPAADTDRYATGIRLEVIF